MPMAPTSKSIRPSRGQRIEEGKLAYFRARTRLRIHAMLLEEFDRSGLRQAELARMLGKKPEVVNRLLGEPGNHRLDTLSDFLFAMSGSELSDTPCPIEQKPDPGPPTWLTHRSPTLAAPQETADSDAFVLELRP